MDDWLTIKLRRALADYIEKFLETPEAKRRGLTNLSQVVDVAVRELLKELIENRFKHINIYEDKVRLLDNKIGKSGDIVTISFRGTKHGFCEYDQSESCVHVKVAWEIPEVNKVLKKAGLKPPELT